ncbi:isocyanide synthase family protein [Candidatus Pacearchaeota archaeon]|nr:isocyanide synthase family protein [Candidatus Pacearchaeota archaeon]
MVKERDIAVNVEEVFSDYLKRAPQEVDRYEAEGKDSFLARAERFISRGEAIQFVMPGFPAKSPNDVYKVLGTFPDGAEEVAFLQFEDFARKVDRVYTPGVNIHLVSDGFVFNDLVGVPDENVRKYASACKELTRGMPIKWHNVFDFYPNTNKAELISGILTEFGMSDEELRERIQKDPDTTMLYNGMHKFMQQDLRWPAEYSKNRIKEEAKPVAKEMIKRSEAYTGLIKKVFPDCVRLSCHPSVNDGAKYSWQFIPGDMSWGAPWHNVLKIDPQGKYSLTKREIALKDGLEIVTERGRPYFVRSPGTTVGIKRDLADIPEKDVVRSTPEEAMSSPVGTVYLVRSPVLKEKGDHIILINGGLVAKPQGMRPETLEFPIPKNNPLNNLPSDGSTLLLRLRGDSLERFYRTHNVAPLQESIVS